jgi:hypothetical protein
MLNNSASSPIDYTCATCGKEFTSRNSLHNHLATHNTSDLKLFTCQLCGSAYKTRADLSKHIGEHDTLKHKMCHECGETFKTSFHLKRHALTRHSNIRPFKCNHCAMTFARKDKLKQHEAKHINHPLYSCSECGKGFYRKEHLKDHEISKHSKQYPFSCEYCAKGFVHSKDLHRHIRVRHLGSLTAANALTLNNAGTSGLSSTAANNLALGLTKSGKPSKKLQKLNQQQNNQQLIGITASGQRINLGNPNKMSNLALTKLGYVNNPNANNMIIQQTQQIQQNQQQIILQPQQQTPQTVQSASDFKSKKISSILKSNLYTTMPVNNNNSSNLMPDLSQINPGLSNANFNNTFNGMNNSEALIYNNNQLISIPLSDLSMLNQHSILGSNNPNAVLAGNNLVNTVNINNKGNTFKIRDQLGKVNDFVQDAGSSQQTIVTVANTKTSMNKINNILNNLNQQQQQNQQQQLQIQQQHQQQIQIQQTQDQILLSNLMPSLTSTSSHSTSKSLIKSFKCNLCNKCFFYENYLKKHMLSKHSSTPMFSCSFCGKGFSNKSNARSHVANSHLDYGCQLCGKMFKSKSLAQRHINTSHAGVSDLKMLEPVKQTKIDAKIIEFSTNLSNSSNNYNNNQNVIQANSLVPNNTQLFIDNNSINNSNNMNILNLIPINTGNTLDLTHATNEIDLNNNFASHPDLNNINVINLNFDGSAKPMGVGSSMSNNFSGINLNDLGLHQAPNQTGLGNIGTGSIGNASMPTFTLNFINNQPNQPHQIHHQQQQQQQQQQHHHQQQQLQQQAFILNQSNFNNQTLNSASYFIE